MGLHPNVSARTILTMYQPVRVFLEQELGRPVNLYTAPDFKTYVQRTLNQEYDIAVTAPHLARLAQLKKRYEPILNFSDELRGLIVVNNKSSIKSVSDLRGKTIALPDRLTVITIMGLEFLRDHGLNPETDVQLFAARSHNNAAIAVERGQADAAVVGSVPYKQLTDDLRSHLRVIASTNAIPSQFVCTSSKLSAEETARVKNALLKYFQTPEGKEFLQSNGFGGVQPATEPILRNLDRYAAEAAKLLEQQ